MKTSLALAEKGLIPRPLIRKGIRNLLHKRLQEQNARFGENPEREMQKWVEHMRSAPIALVPEAANEQHYEVPPAFFELVLGPHRKYSSGYYPESDTTLAEAEQAMLALTCERADLRNGQDILELGCGWGSLTLFMAQRYPSSRITAVSNSAPQRQTILERAKAQGLTNIEVLTADMNTFEAPGTFDRVVSVEMFEHMRNWEALLGKVATWLRPDGRVFLHVFAHQRFAYPFDVKSDTDWMSQHFFSGGMMPSHDLLDHLDTPFEVDERWAVSGEHYARTSEDWAKNTDRHRAKIIELFEQAYGKGQGRRWMHRWRIFFLSCAELFGWDGGQEWIVSHQRLRLKAEASQ